MVKTELDEREGRQIATAPDPMHETVARIFDSTGEAYDGIVDRATDGEDFRWKSRMLPKYADRPRLVKALAAALVPGGTLLLHDFTAPSSPSVRQVWEKRWAGLRDEAARHLPGAVAMMELAPRVVAEEPWVDDLLALLPSAGFGEVGVERLSMGTAAIVKARRKTGPR